MSRLGLLDVEAGVQKNIATELFYEFAKKGSVSISDFDDFKKKLSNELYEKLVGNVKEVYAFVPDTEVVVTKEEMYRVYKKYNE